MPRSDLHQLMAEEEAEEAARERRFELGIETEEDRMPEEERNRLELDRIISDYQESLRRRPEDIRRRQGPDDIRMYLEIEEEMRQR